MNVKQIVNEYQNDKNYDPMYGWTSGINEINERKRYVSANAIYYEKHAKKGIQNCGHMKSSLMLYYIKQENDFNNWWSDHNTKNTFTGY